MSNKGTNTPDNGRKTKASVANKNSVIVQTAVVNGVLTTDDSSPEASSTVLQ